QATASNGEAEAWLVAHAGWLDHARCLKWPFGRSGHGYAGQATVDGVREAAYRHMCRLAHGNSPSSEHQAAHSCGKGHEGCINPNHLRWATPAENQSDR